MNITMLAGYFPPEQTADTRLNQDIVETLINRGYKVTLIVPFPIRNVDEIIQKEYISKKYEKISSSFEIYRIGKPQKYNQNILIRGVSFIFKSLRMYFLARKVETDVFFVISTPPTLGYVAAKLAKKNKVVYKLQDAFPDSLVHSKKLKNSSFIIRVFRKLEKKVYNNVDYICTVSRDLKKTLVERGVSEDKISVIYDWIDENKCKPIDRVDNYLFDRFCLDRKKKYIVYAGNIGMLQNIKSIVLVSKRFLESDPDVEFVIIGDGSWKSELDEMLKTNEYKNVHCFSMQPDKEIAYVYSLGDIGLVSLKHDITKIALPSKTWDIMSAGRAVLCEIDLYSELCDIVNRIGAGMCVEPGDIDGMEKTIRSMLSSEDNLIRMGASGRKYICDNLTKNISVDKYIEIFREIGEI